MSSEVLDAPRPLNVLLVEDDAGDVLIAREALAAGQLSTVLEVVSDGVEAMAYLRHENGYADVQRPDLILLDLNLPKKNGLEMLNEIKSVDDLKAIPVVILTTSEAEPDINKSFDLSANCYITKPIDVERLTMVMNSIKES